MGGSTGLTSAAGIIAQLDEDQKEVKEFALQKLNDVVNEFWAEIAASIKKIEILYEDESFRSRELAALVASKVYYHLEQFNEAMTFALGAGKLFDVSQSSEYVDTLVAKCIDEYIRLRTEQAEGKDASAVKIDERLERIVLGMFDRCFNDKKYKQAVGIAIETRRLDKVEQAISGSDDIPAMLSYAQKVAMETVLNHRFRQTILRLLVKLYQELHVPDYLRICECLVFLDDSSAVAQILNNLIKEDNDERELLAYQIAFDLVNNSTQQFLSNVINQLPEAKKQEVPADLPPLEPLDEKKDAMDVDKKSDIYYEKSQKLKTILSGETTISLYLDFLFRNNHTDMLILKNIKTATEGRSSVLHSATIFANAIMHAGTTSDTFLRENLEWLSRATNWAKFSAIAGLGVIHKGHLKEGLSLLSPYLPSQGGSGSAYSEGGSLFALGLIHANHGAQIIQYILKALLGASGNEIVQHGACLGLGVAAMATGDKEVFEQLKNILYMDSAVAGEAAGLAMGLVMLGTASQNAIEDMVVYAHETQHEKIIRGLAVGISLVMYGKEEGADTLIEQLLLDKDPILRYGAMYTIGLAYCGTANNSAIRRLLHVAVSDVSDDVRRAAVTSLGFLLFRQPEQCPKVVSLLAESYNPHVRYGACLALGISCAGTGIKDAIDLLEPLTTDVVDFVRQGALIALSMILIQQTKKQQPKVEQIKKLLDEKISDKHEEVMCKFGAILATGILDAGGRNVTISLHSRSGHANMNAIVGLAIFTQFWYWYPLTHFVSLAFTPTAFIGLNKNLKMPVYKFKSNSPPSLFAYPPNITPEAKPTVEKVHTAILSITKKKETKDKKEEVKKPETKPAEPMDIEKKEEKKEEPEPDFEIKSNPARVTPSQVKHLSFSEEERYAPIQKGGEIFGIVLLKDKKPGTEESFVSPATTGSGSKDEENEPEPPEAFEYDPTKG